MNLTFRQSIDNKKTCVGQKVFELSNVLNNLCVNNNNYLIVEENVLFLFRCSRIAVHLENNKVKENNLKI